MTSKHQAVDALINQLDNGDEVDRCYAAQALGRLKDPRALEALYRRLQDEDLDVCIDAATALGNIGNEDAVQGLIDALHYHNEPDVKQAAVEGLCRCGGARAAAVLLQLLERPDDIQWSETDGWDDWWDLQRQAVIALGEHAATEATPALAALLDSDDGQDIESELLKALVQIGPAGIEQLRQRLDSAEPRRLRRIATALSCAQYPQAHPLLRELLNQPDEDVRVAATAALASCTGPKSLATLIDLLSDLDSSVQAEALRGLEKLDRQAAYELDDTQLARLLGASDSRVRCTALKIMTQQLERGDHPDNPLLELVRLGLESNQGQELGSSCLLLAKAGKTDILDRLRERIGDTELPVLARRQMIQAIGKLGANDRETLQTLWACSQSNDQALRHVALQVLLSLNDLSGQDHKAPSPLDLLLRALDGAPVEWLPGDNDQESNAAKTDDNQKIPLVAVDDQGDALGADSATAPPTLQPNIQQILESVSDAYPAPLVDDKQDEALGSTLEAITRSNIEATLGQQQELSGDSERILGLVDALPEEYADYAQQVHDNARTGERMIQKKRRKPQEIEVDRRLLSARVLGDCSQAEVVQPLLACLMDEDAELRREAADSLGRIVAKHPKMPGIGNILGPITTQLRAGNEEIRLACARTLGALKHKAAIPALLAALDDPDTLVRIQAIRALAAISIGKGSPLSADDHVVLSEVTPDRITRAILDCQQDPEIGVRKAVIDALVELRFPDFDLMLSLGQEEGGALTPAAGRALKSLAPEAATGKLIQALDETPDSCIRRLAIQMLQEIHGSDAA